MQDDLLFRGGMRESYPMGMEELPIEAKARDRMLGSVRGIGGIPHDGMLDVLHMHADLVGATGIELAFKERVPLILWPRFESFEHAEGGDGFTSRRAITHSHAHPLLGMALYGSVYHARIHRHPTVDQR